MIALTYADLNNGELNMALHRLAQHHGFDTKIAYGISRIYRQWESGVKAAREEYKKLLKKYATLDEKGEIKFENPHNPGSFVIPDDKKEAYEAEFKSFTAKHFNITWHKIPIQALESAKLSPQEIVVLEPFFDLTGFEGDVSPLSVVK